MVNRDCTEEKTAKLIDLYISYIQYFIIMEMNRKNIVKRDAKNIQNGSDFIVILMPLNRILIKQIDIRNRKINVLIQKIKQY
jgi:hypothetical protein